MLPTPRLSLIAAVLTAGLTLSACGGSDDKAGKTVEKKKESSVVIKDPSGDVTAKVDGGHGITIQNQDGDVVSGKGLPDGFPSKEIPIIAGALVGGSKGKAGGSFAYTVLLQVDSTDAQAVITEVTSKLKAAGFSATPGMAMSQMVTSSFASPKWAVGVNAVKGDDGKITVSYVVKKS